jgi:transposase
LAEKRIKRMIRAKMPEPNNNVTMTMGNKILTDAIFADTGLNVFLNGLKREQGDSVSDEVAALVSNSIEMTGISINRLDRMLESDTVRDEYGLKGDARSVYRTVERIGRNNDLIVQYLGNVLKERYGVTMSTVFMDWTSMYFETAAKGIVRFGYSRDHRPDRPQVTVGLSIDKDSGMPVGLTVMPGNVLDVTHFPETMRQIMPLLPDDAMVVFDNGAYSKDNAAFLDKEGFGFVTRLQMNASDDKFIRTHSDAWIESDNGMLYMPIRGNLDRMRFIFRSEKRKKEILDGYRRKAERDYDEMTELRAAVDKKKRPRKKHRNSNCFVDTRLSYMFPLDRMTKEDAVEYAVNNMISGREGLFVLLTNRSLTASETLELYRSRNAAESSFRDLKHGIDWRPARCTSPYAVRGRILISFLALFCISMLRFLYPEFKTKTAESISEELGSFSLTVETERNGTKRRIWSNFSVIIVRIGGRKRPVWAPSVPKQASLGIFG